MVEKAKATLTRVQWALRLRRALLALSISVFLSLALVHLQRYFGFAFPAVVFLAPLAFPVLAFALPLPAERVWFWAGRRLGIGGKLAGLSAALTHRNAVFLRALLDDLPLPLVRLFFPEVFSLVPALILSALFALPPSSALVQPEVLVLPEIREQVSSPAIASPVEKARQKTASPEIPRFPSEFSDRPSYPFVLSALFGEELTLEEAVEKLSQEEGLLRRLADLLTQAQDANSLAEISPEIGELLEDLGRPDLREALSQALAAGEKGLEEAQALVTAALEGTARAKTEVLSSTPEGEENPEISEGIAVVGEGTEGQLPRGSADTMMVEEASVLPREELAEVQEGLGLGAGWEQGEPVHPGIPQENTAPWETVTADTRVGEGPVRTGVALSLPGETSTQEPPGEVQISPQDVEVLVREASLPPALRELVRRYFELLAGGES